MRSRLYNSINKHGLVYKAGEYGYTLIIYFHTLKEETAIMIANRLSYGENKDMSSALHMRIIELMENIGKELENKCKYGSVSRT